jgi:hypothetical protein
MRTITTKIGQKSDYFFFERKIAAMTTIFLEEVNLIPNYRHTLRHGSIRE